MLAHASVGRDPRRPACRSFSLADDPRQVTPLIVKPRAKSCEPTSLRSAWLSPCRICPVPLGSARHCPDPSRIMSHRPAYKRVLLKLSGEALMGRRDYGLDNDTVRAIAADIAAVAAMGVQVCLVIGGGNIFRGVSGAAAGMERAQADYIGMLPPGMHALGT